MPYGKGTYGSKAGRPAKKKTKAKAKPKETNENRQILMPVKKKSTVNKAGNYTKPTMRKNLFNKIKAGTKGGKAGQWSARKAQMLAKECKAKGGGYR